MAQPSGNVVQGLLNTTPYATPPKINVTSSPYGGASSPAISPTNIPIPGVASLSPQGGVQGAAGSNLGSQVGMVAAPKTAATQTTALKSGDPGTMTDPVTHQVFPIPNYKPPTATPVATPTATPPAPQIGGPAQGGLTPEQIAAGNAAANKSSTLPPPTPMPNNTPPPSPQNAPYTNTGAPPFTQTVGALASTAGQSSPEYQAAQSQYRLANQGLADLKTDAAVQTANIGGSRTNLAEAGGEQGLLQNLVAGKEAALTGEMTAAQAAAQTATGQQGTQQAGLAAAGGLSAPQNANVFGTYNPLNPTQYTNYGGGTGGGTFQAGQAAGNYAAGQNFQQTIAPAYNNAQGILNGTASDPGLNAFLKDNPALNPTDVNFVNQIKAWGEGQQLSDPRYAKLTQYLNEFLQTLTPIVGSQGVSNYKTQLVQSMVDPSAKNSSIQDQLNNLWNIASGKVGSTYSTGQGNYTPSANSGSTQEGTTQSWGGYNYIYQNGKWIPK